MYHNGNPNIIEGHDDAEVQSAELDLSNPEAPLLHVVYKLVKPGEYASEGLRLHSTNGVNHRYDPVSYRAEEKSLEETASDEGSEAAPAKSKKGK